MYVLYCRVQNTIHENVVFRVSCISIQTRSNKIETRYKHEKICQVSKQNFDLISKVNEQLYTIYWYKTVSVFSVAESKKILLHKNKIWLVTRKF